MKESFVEVKKSLCHRELFFELVISSSDMAIILPKMMAQLGELHPHPMLVPVLARSQVPHLSQITSESPTASRLRMMRGARFSGREDEAVVDGGVSDLLSLPTPLSS